MLSFWPLLLIISRSILNVFPQQFEPKPQTEKLFMTNKSDHLIWFLQISDIHISAFKDPSRLTEFREFCENAINVFKPSLVIASGDITDGRNSDGFTTQQIEKEWSNYQNVLTGLNVSQHMVWLDIRGNHDTFNVLDLKSNQNYFVNYSVRGKANPRSYLYQLDKNGDVYSFIAVDVTLRTGPRFPFNFAGFLDSGEAQVVDNITKQVESSDSSYTIWFGHYPTSCVVSHEPGGIRSLIGRHGRGLVYLCGHLHTFVPEMYTMHEEGFLELELGDWKENRMYRLLAVDHGLLSFVDVKHQDWPKILITNPKHALFVIPDKENLEIIRESTHVRLLVFSIAPIEFVKVRVDNENWTVCENIDGPLYAAPWNPKMYSTGLHHVKVHVKDAFGRNKYETQSFSLDGTKLSFSLLPTFVLKTSANIVFKLMFWIVNILILAPLLLLKLLQYRDIRRGNTDQRNCRSGCICYRKLWTVVSVDRIFWPLVVYQIYLSSGPWTVGYIIEDHIGAIFVWGIHINGVFLTGSFTYLYGFMQLLIFQLPLILVLAFGVDHRMQSFLRFQKVSWFIKIGLHLPFFIILACQFILAYFFGSAYGIMACLLCPIHTWAIVFSSILWMQSFSLQKHHPL
ncbi:hypothetical protein PPYR_07600 [Photinus pyralis]|uniref:Uncharacterized protein n=1 Tax=Photinus pyralis TaxID=7054 RepID=A0A1Y1LX72_PHOPY|nr:transmembrane protein 62-like [Photinus pyralis]XP_031341696.1 transmembrane protein 62-like [Photinus pyralis]KAB0799720.1 hypothetical protein PPYR_07600 [Photinus pyralis]